MRPLALVLFLLALAFDREHALVERDLDVLLLHGRQLGADQVLLLRFADVGGGGPLIFLALPGCCHAWPAGERCRQHAVEYLIEPGEGFPTNESHGVTSV